MVHDHTDYSKPTLTVSKTVLWMMLIAFILLVAVVAYYRYRGEVEPINLGTNEIKQFTISAESVDKYWFENHSELKPLTK